MVDLARRLDPREDDARGPCTQGRILSVAVVVVAYNSDDALARCLDALGGEADEIVVVNNGGPLRLERQDVQLVEPGANLGFGAACNLGVRSVSSGVVVFVNPDTVVRPGAARALEHALEDTTIGAAQARLRLLDRPDLLNSGGNLLHPSGLAWPGGYGEPADALRVPAEIAYPSGAAFGMRTELFRDLGGFTEELFLYQEDLDLGWRLWQRGLRVVVEPAADVLHDYVVERPGRRKEYYLERNRLVFVLTTYSRRLLVLAAPILLAVELGVAIIALREGWAREKLRGWVWLVRERRWLHARRARLQAERVVGDGQLARLFTPAIRLPMVEQPPGLSALNAVLGAWWRFVRVLL